MRTNWRGIIGPSRQILTRAVLLHQMRGRQVALAITIGLIALGAGRAEANLIVDQQQLLFNSGGGAINPGWTSFGQSFTPTLSSIQWAEFTLKNQSSPFVPIDLQLAILDGQVGSNGLGGPVLAVSPNAVLSDTSFTTVHFQLSTPLALTPGHQYVLQVNILTTNASLGWEQAFTAYSGGQMLQSPYNTSILAGQQYVFSEGIVNDSGLVPPDANTGKCEDVVAKNLKTLFVCITKCHIKQADAALKGEAFDKEACEQGTGKPVSCRAKYDKATSKLLKAAICPACLNTEGAQGHLADLATSFVENNNAQIYCAGTTPLP